MREYRGDVFSLSRKQKRERERIQRRLGREYRGDVFSPSFAFLRALSRARAHARALQSLSLPRPYPLTLSLCRARALFSTPCAHALLACNNLPPSLSLQAKKLGGSLSPLASLTLCQKSAPSFPCHFDFFQSQLLQGNARKRQIDSIASLTQKV